MVDLPECREQQGQGALRQVGHLRAGHPFVWNEETTRAWAVAFLQAVKDEMTEEGVQWLREQFEAYDDYAGGAGPIAG